MTVYHFQKAPLRGDPTGVVLFQDAILSRLAPVNDAVTGVPLPASKLNRQINAEWPSVTSTVPALFYRAGNGVVSQLLPVLGTSPVTVAGAKGGNAALTSLIAALIAAGIPLKDTTT